ncbi:MAG: STAS domain-containing protein [Sedimentisphaerales bacterium]|nr:STAS domain-containing protein [Sedimentisphaerales bacterium]
MRHRHTNDSDNDVVRAIRRQDKAVVLELAGEIDLHRSVKLRERLLDLTAERPDMIVINLSEVSFMDSSGLATLVEALQLCRRNGGALKLVGIQERVRSILEISRLDHIFPIFDSESEAMAS